MTSQEYWDKVDAMSSARDKLPEDVHILYGEIGYDMEIVLSDSWEFGIKEAARTLGLDITWRHLYASTWEASFMLDGVKVSQLTDEREVPGAQTS